MKRLFEWIRRTVKKIRMNRLALIAASNNHKGAGISVDTWNPSTVNEPANYSTLVEGSYNWYNPQGLGLRFSFHWNGALYSIVNDGSRDLFDFYVTPRIPDQTGEGKVQYRAEITRDWESFDPPGTREWLGWGYYFPAGSLLPRVHEVDIMQKHTGSGPNPPYDFNYPVYYMGLAYEGQGGAVHNEIVIVNKVRDFEVALDNGRTNTGYVIQELKEYHFVVYDQAGTGANGFIQIWVKNVTDGEAWTLIYDEQESTIWNQDTDGGSNAQVKGDWKLGVYAHGIVSVAGLELDEAENSGVGSYTVRAQITKINNKILLASDPSYNANLFGVIKTI